MRSDQKLNSSGAVIELLEPRQLLSAGLNDGLLSIRGTNRGDVIRVKVDSTRPSLLRVFDNGRKSLFRRSSIDRVSISTAAGNDEITVAWTTGLRPWQLTILDGKGDDELYGVARAAPPPEFARVAPGPFDPAHLVSFLQIGGSGPNEWDRRVGWNIKAEGWQGFVNKYVIPSIQWGVRRIELHNPFGTHVFEPMQFDQYLEAQAEGLTWLTEGFVEAWKPITDSGVEVIAYLGSLTVDLDFTERTEAEWQQRFHASIQPLLDAGMSIGFDASATTAMDSPVYKAAIELQDAGVRSYVEARPAIWSPHWWSWPVISMENWWHRSDPEAYAEAAVWAAPTTVLIGEIVRIVEPPTGHSWDDRQLWLMSVMRRILADGHTVAVSIPTLMDMGMSLHDVLG